MSHMRSTITGEPLSGTGEHLWFPWGPPFKAAACLYRFRSRRDRASPASLVSVKPGNARLRWGNSGELGETARSLGGL